MSALSAARPPLRRCHARCLLASLALLAAGCTIQDEPLDDDTAAATDVVEDTGSGTGSSGSTTGNDVSSGDDASSTPTDTNGGGDTRQPEWPGCVIVDRYEVVPFNIAPRFDRIGHHMLMTFTSADEFRAALGTEPPPAIDFATEWAALVSNSDWWYGGDQTLRHLQYCPSQVFVETHVAYPGPGCAFLDIWARATLLVTFPAIATPVSLDGGGAYAQDTTPIQCDQGNPAAGEPCTHQTLCQPGLLCAGLTRADSGTCTALENVHEVSNAVTMPIADASSSATVSHNQLHGVAGIDADVIVSARFDHPSPSDLRIALVHPSGEHVVLWDHEPTDRSWSAESDSANLYRAAVGFTGAAVSGDWMLEVTDDVPGNTGQLVSWSVTVVTR